MIADQAKREFSDCRGNEPHYLEDAAASLSAKLRKKKFVC
jgi:hypothetical protein